jgi:hypothetical protein
MPETLNQVEGRINKLKIQYMRMMSIQGQVQEFRHRRAKSEG